MHVCTYIIHVHRSKGQKTKEQHTTHALGRGKGCQGTEEALLILRGAGVVNRGPLAGGLAEWVDGTQRKRLKG